MWSLEVVERRAEQERDLVVGGLGAMDDDLGWDDGSLSVDEKWLFGPEGYSGLNRRHNNARRIPRRTRTTLEHDRIRSEDYVEANSLGR